MQINSFLQYYLELNIMIACLSLFLAFVLLLGQKKIFYEMISWSKLSGIFRLLSVSAFIFPLFKFQSQSEIWVGPVAQKFSQVHSYLEKNNLDKLPQIVSNIVSEQSINFNFGFLSWILVAGSFLGLGLFIIQYLRSKKQIQVLEEQSILIKESTELQLKIYVGENIKGPFSITLLAEKYVFLPLHSIEDKALYNVCLAHELQHIRQKDTSWIYFYESLRYVLFYNPFVWVLFKQINQMHELACDETLIGRHKVSAKAYGLSLLKEAQHQVKRSSFKMPIASCGTLGHSLSGEFLKRRITMICKKNNLFGLRTKFFNAILVCSFAILSFGVKAMVAPGKLLKREEADFLVSKMRKRSTVPVYLDSSVLKWLNQILNSESSKNFLRSGLKNMQDYRPMIEEQLAKYNLPQELLYIPLFESGYKNYDNGVGAGIWSFIQETARAYGLRVDQNVDERLNPTKETKAAMLYYSHLKQIQQFENNWHLILMAYNSGEKALMQAMDEVDSTNAQDVIQRSQILRDETKNYLPKFMAYLIIAKNPQLLDR